MRSPALCSHRSEKYCATRLGDRDREHERGDAGEQPRVGARRARTAPSPVEQAVDDERQRPRLGEVGGGQHHGRARRRRRAPATGARRTAAACGRRGSCAPPRAGRELVEQQLARCARAPSRSSAAGARPERRAAARSRAASVGGVEPLRVEHAHRAEPLEPPRAPRCSSSSAVAYGTTSAGHAGADELERGVVAALADRRGGARAARRRGRARVRHELEPRARRAARAARSPRGVGQERPGDQPHRHAGPRPQVRCAPAPRAAAARRRARRRPRPPRASPRAPRGAGAARATTKPV